MYNQKVAVVKRLKKESIYGLSAKKVAVAQRWPLWRGHGHPTIENIIQNQLKIALSNLF